jgi:hypothetical protein
MPTVEEVLRQSGFTDDQIAQMDQRAISAFGGVITDANKSLRDAKAAQDAAELAQRSNIDFYENRIAPSLANWEEEKSRIENEKARTAAELAYYRTQAEEAKKTGFIPAEAPGFDASKFAAPSNPPRDGQGRYVAGAPGGTPGSPQYVAPNFDVNKVYERAGDAVGIIADIQWEHQRLFGRPLPISPTELVRQADAQKLDPKMYAARVFNFDARRQEMAQEEAKKHDDAMRAEGAAPLEQKLKESEELRKKEVAENDRKWAERVGSNPDLRMPQVNPRMTDIAKAVKANDLPDPLSLNDAQRRALTSQMIRKDIEMSQAT